MRSRIAIAAALVLVLSLSATATRISTDPADPGEGTYHLSFVRGYVPNGANAPVNREIVATDVSYTSDVRNNWVGNTVDIVMQQCFSGGFLDNISGTSNFFNVAQPGVGKNFTFASAASWRESALNADGFTAGANPKRFLDNFTRAFRQDQALGNTSNLAHFSTATLDGNPPIPFAPIARDPYAPGGARNTATVFEHPQYNSTNAAADNRVLGGADQYAILVAWSAPNQRHEINNQREYDTLRNLYNVPINNIVVLDGGRLRSTGDPASRIQAQAAVLPSDPLGLSSVFIDGPNTRDNWLAALKGDLFTGTKPTASSQLLIYNTGHGGHAAFLRRIAPEGFTYRYFFELKSAFNDSDGAEVDIDNADPTSTSGVEGRLAAGFDYIQITASTNLDASSVAINGAPLVPSLSPYMVTSPDLLYDVTGVLSDFGMSQPISYVYQVPISTGLLQSTSGGLETSLDFTGLSDPSVISSFDFIGGDQEYLVVVPEPGTLVMLAAGMAVLCLRRVRHRHRGKGV